MDDLERHLLAIEEGFWTGGEDYYLAHADMDCLAVFPGMAELMARADLAASVAQGSRWRDVEIAPKAFHQLSPDVAVVAYEGRAVRGEDERHRALVSSGYVRRNDGWKLAWHQQTPLA